MQVEWYGQSAFRLAAAGTTVVIDPFGERRVAERGPTFYRPVAGVAADLVLVTHEHEDHNGFEDLEGDPPVLRSTAGTFDSPIGEVVAIASEHDAAAGTQRGPNTIFAFELDGTRVAHLGDFGQRELRAEQAEAIGPVELLFVPVGGSPTIDAEQAAAIVARLAPRWVVPMHYGTARFSFFDEPEPFLARMAHVRRLDAPLFDTEELAGEEGRPLAVVPASP